MESAYQAAYDLLDPSLQKALAEDGIRSDPTSANQFRIFWEQSKSVSPNCPVSSASFDQLADWLGIAQGHLANAKRHKPQTSLHEQLHRLYRASLSSKPWDSHIGMLAFEHDSRQQSLRNQQAANHPLVELAAKKWRHWKPRDAKGLPLATQEAIEAQLRDKWLDRLLAALSPLTEHLQYLRKYKGPDSAFHHKRLFGKAKYGTIKHHTIVYEKLIQTHPDILQWQDDHSSIHRLFDHLVHKKRMSSTFRNIWNTINWLSDRTGNTRPDTHKDMKRMYDHEAQNLVTRLYTTLKRSRMLPRRSSRPWNLPLTNRGAPPSTTTMPPPYDTS